MGAGDMLNLTYSIADQKFETTKSLGILNMSVGLLRHLAGDPRVRRLTVLSNSTLAACEPNQRVQTLNYDSAIRSRRSRLMWDQWGAYGAARATGNDWLFLPKGFASFIRTPPCRLAACVHDAMHAHYAVRYPGQLPALESWYFRRSFHATLAQAAVVFTDSDFIRLELQRMAGSLGIRLPRVVTAGIGFSASTMGPFVKHDQIAILAGRWPHKLTALAMQYANRWQIATAYQGKILWIGQPPPNLSLPAHQNWSYHPRLPETEFRRILGESRVLVFFSDYEGFGMPPVEAAMSLTCPVYSSIPVTREVMAGAGFPFENEDYHSFAKALEAALRCDPGSIEEWRQRLLRLHDWKDVVDTVVDTLLS